jgi:hypothetical protein
VACCYDDMSGLGLSLIMMCLDHSWTVGLFVLYLELIRETPGSHFQTTPIRTASPNRILDSAKSYRIEALTRITTRIYSMRLLSRQQLVDNIQRVLHDRYQPNRIPAMNSVFPRYVGLVLIPSSYQTRRSSAQSTRRGR